MNYTAMAKGIFLRRPNRFIAHCLVEGQEVVAHVKNTGRCRELLLPGVTVWLQYHPSPTRKTDWSLIGVEKKGKGGTRLINMDSQIPNAVFREGVEQGRILLPGLERPVEIKGEVTVGHSRLDFRLQSGRSTAYVEVKGVTLEEGNIARFPDAPTQRGVKHLEELAALAAEGYTTCLALMVQMQGVTEFRPNWRTHPQFGEAMLQAQAAGVHLLCWDCIVTPTSIVANRPVPICLNREG